MRLLRLLLVLLVVVLPGCSLLADEEPATPAPGQSGGADARDPADVAGELRQLLAERVRSVRRNDLTEFLATVHRGRTELVARQRRWFTNLQELPTARFGFTLVPGSVDVLGRDRVRAVVRTRLQLAGYDAHPVVSSARHTFRRDRQGRLRLVSDRDRAWGRAHDQDLAPWDVTAIEVVEGDGVLGVFDERSADAAYQIVPAVEQGIRDVARHVPVDWSETVVLYALSDVDFLAGLDDLPGGDPDRLDGVAFPVRAGVEGRRLAGIRFLLHPRMLDRDDETRDRLIRHELTHVALARRDDRVPTWLSEGIAEWVSVRPIPPHRRMISRDAVRAAHRGVDRLPGDRTFNGPRSGANYGIAWWACEHLVATYGEETLWELLDAMGRDGGTDASEQDRVLRRVLGITGDELARAAGRGILATFG